MNDHFSLIFCFSGELCSTAPSVHDIHDNKIRLPEHPIVSAVDGKAGRDIFHLLRKQRLGAIILSLDRQAFQHDEIAYMRILCRQASQLRVGQCVKSSLPADVKNVYLLIFNQIYQDAA